MPEQFGVDFAVVSDAKSLAAYPGLPQAGCLYGELEVKYKNPSFRSQHKLSRVRICFSQSDPLCRRPHTGKTVASAAMPIRVCQYKKRDSDTRSLGPTHTGGRQYNGSYQSTHRVTGACVCQHETLHALQVPGYAAEPWPAPFVLHQYNKDGTRMRYTEHVRSAW
eukprot:3937836-Rhodomonas_salina.5